MLALLLPALLPYGVRGLTVLGRTLIEGLALARGTPLGLAIVAMAVVVLLFVINRQRRRRRR